MPRHPPDSWTPMPPQLLLLLPWRQTPGRPGSGPGCWTHRPGPWQKCTAAARWWRPPRSHPRCATGGEDETQADQLISQPKSEAAPGDARTVPNF